MKQAIMSFQDWIGLVMTGVLGVLWFDIRNIRISGMSETTHDKICDLKLKPIHDKLDELHADIRELLKK